MRRWLAWTLLAALLAAAETTSAGIQPPLFYSDQSILSLRIAGSPDIGISARPDATWLDIYPIRDTYIPALGTVNQIYVNATIWSTVDFGPGTALFTGVPLISNLMVTCANHPSGFFATDTATGPNPLGPGTFGPGLSGIMHLDGQAVIRSMAGSIQVPVPLVLGGGTYPGTTMVTLQGHPITVTGVGFLTGPLVITDVTTNVITIPARGNVQGCAFTLQPTPQESVHTVSTGDGYVSVTGGPAAEQHTVTVSGTNSLDDVTLYPGGHVTLVSPLRIDTSTIAGRLPGAATLRLVYSAPEPGMTLLLVCGAVALAVLGRRRMRR